MPKHRPHAEQIGQPNLFISGSGLNPTKPATTLDEDHCMQLVLKTLQRHGARGATRFELAKELGFLLDNTVGPRLSDLRRYGLICKTEAERDGAIVWVAR